MSLRTAWATQWFFISRAKMGSAVKSAWCEPEFSSQHPCQAVHKQFTIDYGSSSRKFNILFWPLQALTHTCTHEYTHAHIHTHTKWNLILCFFVCVFFKATFSNSKETNKISGFICLPSWGLVSTHLIFHRWEIFYLPSTTEYPLPLWPAIIVCHQTLNRCFVPNMDTKKKTEYKILHLWMGA